MLPVAGNAAVTAVLVRTVTATSNVISAALSSTTITAEPALSTTSVVLSSKSGSANVYHNNMYTFGIM